MSTMLGTRLLRSRRHMFPAEMLIATGMVAQAALLQALGSD